MEAALAALIILTVVLFGALTIVQVYLSSQDAILESWREMEERRGERARTQISPVGATTDGSFVWLTLENEGETKLADFDRWDVIAQYEIAGGNKVERLSYVEHEPLFDYEWTEGIEDVFEPDIFNPGETMVITMNVSSEITPTGRAIIATPNGITASTVFTR